MKKNQVQKHLHDDPQIEDKDIPRLIERAEELYQQEQARNKKLSSQEIINIASEVDIPKQYIQQAISEYQNKNKGRQMTNSSGLKKEWIIIGALLVIVAVVLLRPQPPVQINNQVIVNSTPEEKQIAASIPTTNPVTAHPKTKKIQTAEPSKTTSSPPPVAKTITPPKGLEGSWYLVSYFANDKGDFFEVPIAKTPIELRETWSFTEPRFRHVMDKSLSFSGKFSLQDPLPMFSEHKLINGTQYLLVGENVRASIPTIKREFDYYHIELSEKQLLVFYLGTKKEISKLPSQGHLFEREPI